MLRYCKCFCAFKVCFTNKKILGIRLKTNELQINFPLIMSHNIQIHAHRASHKKTFYYNFGYNVVFIKTDTFSLFPRSYKKTIWQLIIFIKNTVAFVETRKNVFIIHKGVLQELYCIKKRESYVIWLTTLCLIL